MSADVMGLSLFCFVLARFPPHNNCLFNHAIKSHSNMSDQY